MQINGLLKTTLLDFPTKVAATVFLAGCNYRCPFCHNFNLVNTKNEFPVISEESFFSFLDSRKRILDGICITGGEPTLRPDLPDFIARIKEYGYSVKLDTNGSNPEMVKNLIMDKLIDYVAMDIKSSIEEYPNISGIRNLDTDNIIETVHLLKSNIIPCEFRTTFVSEYHNAETVAKIGKWLNGADNYFIQSFKDSEFVPNHSLTPCTKEQLLSYKELLNPYIKNVALRGVD